MGRKPGLHQVEDLRGMAGNIVVAEFGQPGHHVCRAQHDRGRDGKCHHGRDPATQPEVTHEQEGDVLEPGDESERGGRGRKLVALQLQQRETDPADHEHQQDLQPSGADDAAAKEAHTQNGVSL